MLIIQYQTNTDVFFFFLRNKQTQMVEDKFSSSLNYKIVEILRTIQISGLNFFLHYQILNTKCYLFKLLTVR